MRGKFTIRIGKKIHVFENYEDIPDTFDNVVEFLPEYPEPPHTEEQHEYIETFSPKLLELLNREKKHASSN
jgi:hypothetical protein